MKTLTICCIVMFIVNFTIDIMKKEWASAIGWACAALWAGNYLRLYIATEKQ